MRGEGKRLEQLIEIQDDGSQRSALRAEEKEKRPVREARKEAKVELCPPRYLDHGSVWSF
jgi:hypothetical protein